MERRMGRDGQEGERASGKKSGSAGTWGYIRGRQGRQVENKNKIETWKSQYVVVCRHGHNIITQRK